MKIAFSNLACPEWSLSEVARRAAEYGYGGVELRLMDGEVIRGDLDADARRRIRAEFRAAGVALVGVGASTRFAQAGAEEREQLEAALLQYAELAAALEAPFVRTFGGVFEAAERNAAVARVAESLQRVAERAGGLGVQILLETHDGFSSSAAVRDALARAPSPQIGALWDTHHPVRMGETAAATLANLSGRLRHVHLKDARRSGDGWDLVPFGEGEVPLADIVRLLRESGYDGWYCVEWERRWHPELAPASEALPQHLRALRALL